MTRKSAVKVQAEDKLADAKRQGQAQFNSILEMVLALKAAGDDDDAREEAEQAIQEDALSVQVRSGWYQPGCAADDIMRKPCEYEILLCTGGPAARIIGQVSDHGEPETATIEVQDWFQPWTAYYPTVTVADLKKGRSLQRRRNTARLCPVLLFRGRLSHAPRSPRPTRHAAD